MPEYKSQAKLSGPAGLIACLLILAGGAAILFFGRPAFLDGILRTSPLDASISQETLHEKAAETLKRDIQIIYRQKYMVPLIDSASAKTKARATDIVAINRSIDSLTLTSLSVRRRFATIQDKDLELIVTANYAMTPPLDHITTRSFRVIASNYGKGPWTFYGEISP